MLRVFRYSDQHRLSFRDVHIEYITVTPDTDILHGYIQRITPKIPGTRLSIYLDNYVILKDNTCLIGSTRNNYNLEVTQDEVKKALLGYYEPRNIYANVFYRNTHDLNILKSICTTTEVNFLEYPPLGDNPDIFERNGIKEYHSLHKLYRASWDAVVYYYILCGVPHVSTVFNFSESFPVDHIEARPHAHSDIATLYRDPRCVLSTHQHHQRMYDDRVLAEMLMMTKF